MSPSTSSAQSSGSPSEMPSSPMPTLACMQPDVYLRDPENGGRAAFQMTDAPSCSPHYTGKPGKDR